MRWLSRMSSRRDGISSLFRSLADHPVAAETPFPGSGRAVALTPTECADTLQTPDVDKLQTIHD